MINGDVLSRMKTGAMLINTSRGPVVKLDALVAAISSGHIAGAGIDVFPDEPLPTDHPILQLPQVVVSPHMASHSQMSMVRMALVAEDIARVLQGEAPRYPVLPE
jgi:phosphoglycerate dehydrogenase-like enzyme